MLGNGSQVGCHSPSLGWTPYSILDLQVSGGMRSQRLILGSFASQLHDSSSSRTTFLVVSCRGSQSHYFLGRWQKAQICFSTARDSDCWEVSRNSEGSRNRHF